VDVALTVAASVLDQQIPLIDAFAMTPLDRLGQLPLDPTGLLRRMVPQPIDDQSVNDGVWSPHGALAVELANPVTLENLLRQTGVTAVARVGYRSVYAAHDNAGAAQLLDFFARNALTDLRKGPGINGLPSAQCFVPTPSGLPAYYCVATANNYAIAVQGDQEAQTHQLISAQYLMLTAP
jgi:hypothetical protein